MLLMMKQSEALPGGNLPFPPAISRMPAVVRSPAAYSRGHSWQETVPDSVPAATRRRHGTFPMATFRTEPQAFAWAAQKYGLGYGYQNLEPKILVCGPARTSFRNRHAKKHCYKAVSSGSSSQKTAPTWARPTWMTRAVPVFRPSYVTLALMLRVSCRSREMFQI
jgi:hypothetical protein